ncbi:hypothetical protein KP612_03545 [Treponema denticola]|uniref:Uncharacterized protein n=2 Tax=Treponema denticola TaxID=158 RepID=Q73NS1_TREDE|nr:MULTISPECIES: hypothetical protein [Treponema]AAS11570.1 conserved hypothetical protein [Treponema denticola ATCC 35405]EMB30757.1 hypothetical protein HMPREF9726_02442 [Treponema denticola H-22]EMB34055.1 hypothetical protein HMPREF9721_02465 [Treponema denticola ATCC 35404]EMB36524.1 hypothetical protein HMPREF9735_01901 [Treponema denticola ATCC 33521]HCY96376.1 hypothetical protein [Treponema sp.]
MKHTKKIAFLIFFVSLFSVFPVYAEDTKVSKTPDPYGAEEFKQWQKDLRRFEIITFGALPFVSLLSFWAYDIGRSIAHKGDPAYNPWPLKDAKIAVKLTEKEQLGVFLTAVGISLGVAIIDITYRSIKRANAKKLEEKNEEPAILLIPIEENKSEETETSKTEESDDAQ